MISVGKIVRPKAEPLGVAMTARGQPQGPQRPMRHPRTGQPPTIQYRKNHPMLTQAPVGTPALPVRATQGPSTTAIGQYLKALRGR